MPRLGQQKPAPAHTNPSLHPQPHSPAGAPDSPLPLWRFGPLTLFPAAPPRPPPSRHHLSQPLAPPPAAVFLQPSSSSTTPSAPTTTVFFFDSAAPTPDAFFDRRHIAPRPPAVEVLWRSAPSVGEEHGRDPPQGVQPPVALHVRHSGGGGGLLRRCCRATIREPRMLNFPHDAAGVTDHAPPPMRIVSQGRSWRTRRRQSIMKPSASTRSTSRSCCKTSRSSLPPVRHSSGLSSMSVRSKKTMPKLAPPRRGEERGVQRARRATLAVGG